MFDLMSGGPRHPFHEPTIVPTVVSIAGHGLVLLALAGASFAVATDQLPDLPDMMAFVTAAPAPSPPPPPPPPARRAAAVKAQPLAATRAAAPVEAPAAIVSEMAIVADAVAVFAAGPERHPDAIRADGHLEFLAAAEVRGSPSPAAAPGYPTRYLLKAQPRRPVRR